MKPGALLINLGTPNDPSPASVGRYLREFLNDPYVIDIPAILRWLLVNVAIVPRRKFASAKAYQTVWTERGSPLRFHLHDLTEKVRIELGSAWQVEMAMRYGEPSIRGALERLRASGAGEIMMLPLYPQYAESSTRSSVEKVHLELAAMGWSPTLKVVPAFFQQKDHIAAWVELIRDEAGNLGQGDHLLMSFHGLPARHLTKIDKTGTCQPLGASEVVDDACCAKALTGSCPALATCYRAQSLVTATRIAEGLGLRREQWSLSFQSRLGRTPWIQPFTDVVLPRLAQAGHTRVIVATPSFVADCLETIEEIGDRGRESFVSAAGGRRVQYQRVGCLNSRTSWARAVSYFVVQAHQQPK